MLRICLSHRIPIQECKLYIPVQHKYNHVQLYCCVSQLVMEKDRTQNSGSEHQEELRGLLRQSGNENVSPQPAHLHNLLHNQSQYTLN